MAPLSLLVPVNINALFECEALCVQACDVIWYVGDNSTANRHQRQQYESQGFTFSDNHSVLPNGTHTATSTLTINASVNVDNLRLHCLAILSGEHTLSALSKPVTLQVISGEYPNQQRHGTCVCA